METDLSLSFVITVMKVGIAVLSMRRTIDKEKMVIILRGKFENTTNAYIFLLRFKKKIEARDLHEAGRQLHNYCSMVFLTCCLVLCSSFQQEIMESLTELPDSHNSSLPHPSVRKLTSRMDYVKAKKDHFGEGGQKKGSRSLKLPFQGRY